MPRPSKIVQHKLERIVLDGRRDGKTAQDILKECNAALKRRGANDKVSASALDRYIASLGDAVTAIAHQPEKAEEAYALAIDFGGQFKGLNEKVERWLGEADTAMRTTVDDNGVVIDLGPDWMARTSVAREMREALKMYVDLMERIHNADQIRQFQQVVMEAIQTADPETARRITIELGKRQSIRQAALLGQPVPV